MTWPGFLAQLGSATSVTLIGPLNEKSVNVSEPTVFVDGGARFRSGSEKFPCISVGDGDSGTAHLDVKLAAEKDFSDLAFVLRELPRSVTHLQLFGFLGGRLDHELANLGELHRFLSARNSARAELWRDGKVAVTGFTGVFKEKISGTFSVMVLEACEVEISGACQYKFSGVLEPNSSRGLSNAGSGHVSILPRGPAFVIFC